MFCLHMFMYTTRKSDASGGWKRMLVLLELELQAPYRYWDTNSGPLKMRQVPLTTEPPFYLHNVIF